MIEYDFTPEKLKLEYVNKLSTLDEELIVRIQNRIRKDNLLGKTSSYIYPKITSGWEKAIEHFENLGFCISEYGNDFVKDYDEDGCEVIGFMITWKRNTVLDNKQN